MGNKTKGTPYLVLKNGVWHTDFTLKNDYPNKRFRKTTGFHEAQLDEAQAWVMQYRQSWLDARHYNTPMPHTFHEAVVRFIKERQSLSTIADQATSLLRMCEYVGDIEINQIDNDSFKQYREDHFHKRKLSIKTLKNHMATVRTLMNRAHRIWKDEASGGFWLTRQVTIEMPKVNPLEQKQVVILSFEDQCKLYNLLPDHLQRMLLFKVNTGCREQEVVKLRWDYLMRFIDDQEEGWYFNLPAETMKIKTHDKQVLLNMVSLSVIKQLYMKTQDRVHSRLLRVPGKRTIITKECASYRGEPCDCFHDYVFTYQGIVLNKMNTGGWTKAWIKSGLPSDTSRFLTGVHNLRHTFATRCRGALIGEETRKKLLGHASSSMTTHYSQPLIMELLTAVRKIEPVHLIRNKSAFATFEPVD